MANQWVNAPRIPNIPPVQVQPDSNYYKPKSQHTIDYTVTVSQPVVVKQKRISDFNFDNLFAFGKFNLFKIYLVEITVAEF